MLIHLVLLIRISYVLLSLNLSLMFSVIKLEENYLLAIQLSFRLILKGPSNDSYQYP